MSTEEIRNYIAFNFSAQNRAVTINDYVNKIRTMPSQYGAAAKVGVTEIENKVKVSILSYTPDGALSSSVSSTLKNNISEYLSNYRMINDYIEISSANVIDLGLELDIVITNNANQGEIVGNVINKITQFFNVDAHEMGETISLSEVYGEVSKQDGVLNVIDVRVYNNTGDGYSNSKTSQPTTSNNKIVTTDQALFFLPDEIPQIRYPDVDVRVRVKQISRPNIS